jgi:hypothetical protein
VIYPNKPNNNIVQRVYLKKMGLSKTGWFKWLNPENRFVPWLFFVLNLLAGGVSFVFFSGPAVYFFYAKRAADEILFLYSIIFPLAALTGLCLFLISGFALLQFKRAIKIGTILLTPIFIGTIGLAHLLLLESNIISWLYVIVWGGLIFLPGIVSFLISCFLLKYKMHRSSSNTSQPFTPFLSSKINYDRIPRVVFAALPLLCVSIVAFNEDYIWKYFFIFRPIYNFWLKYCMTDIQI